LSEGRLNQTVRLPRLDKNTDAVARNGKLLILNGSLQGREFILNEEHYSIGSDPTCDIILNDPTVSRRHCEIQFTPTGCLLRDLGSTNGTFVFGVQISEVPLDYGAEFRLGQTSLVFRSLKDTGKYVPGSGLFFGKRFDLSLAIQKFSSHGRLAGRAPRGRRCRATAGDDAGGTGR
jgi:hypothetical protein